MNASCLQELLKYQNRKILKYRRNVSSLLVVVRESWTIDDINYIIIDCMNYITMDDMNFLMHRCSTILMTSKRLVRSPWRLEFCTHSFVPGPHSTISDEETFPQDLRVTLKHSRIHFRVTRKFCINVSPTLHA